MKWISIYLEHPPQYTDCLLGTSKGEVGEGFFDGTYYHAYRSDFDKDAITHFMLLNELPEVPAL